MNVHGAADRLGVSASWLNKLRLTGGGPTYLKIGKKVAYEAEALDAWLAERRRTSTSQEAPAAAA